MIDHVNIGVRDVGVSRRFYELALAPLGIGCVMEHAAGVGFGLQGRPQFWISDRPAGGPVHVAFEARDRAVVDGFHAAALAAGGRDNGPPGLRPVYHPGYYGAFVLDPDGNNVEAVCHRPEGFDSIVQGEPSFFELGVADVERGRAFYGALFAWSFEASPTGGGFAITTAGLPGGLHGGDPDAAPYLFFRVDDIDAAEDRVRALGGTVEEGHDEQDEAGAEKTASFGRFRFCRDDQGSRFGLHQPPPTGE